MSSIPRILLIDDDPDQRTLCRRLLEEAFPSVEVDEAGGAAAFARALVRRSFGLVITSLELGWADGLEVVATLRETVPEAPVIVRVAESRAELAAAALQAGAALHVPTTPRGYLDLPTAVRTALFRAHQRRIREAQDSPYRLMVESLPLGVFTATEDGEILEANPALATILGFPGPQALNQRNLKDLFLHPAEAERWYAQLEAAGSSADGEFVLRRDDGGSVWTRLSAWIVEHEGTGLKQVQGIVEDIDGERRARQELARRSEVLARSCSELEQFASAISHDLREPLHLMDRYARLLAERYAEDLDDKGRRFTEHIVQGAERMRRMIDGILELSRVEIRGERFVPVDFQEVLAEACANLQHAIEESGATITHDLLPTLAADEVQVAQLFQNLLGNAIKFRGEEPPVIHVAAAEQDDHWIFSVADNGIGIDPSASDRVFEIFQRLHTEEEYPGMGLGLALCRRIVERHGGRIWFESEVGHGTTFHFTIPKQTGQWP